MPVAAPSPIETDARSSFVARPDERNGLRVVRVSDVTPRERERMRALLAEYYEGVSAEQFARDLAEKDWVIVGTDPVTGELWLFSTLMQMRTVVDGEPILAFYSGDTVSRQERWGNDTTAAIRLAVTQMYGVAAESPEWRAYWFMISGTFKSYRLLSLLFRDYDPSPARALPAGATRVMRELGAMKGFAEYDEATSVVRFENPTVFRAAAEGPADEADPLLAYFLAANPGVEAGDRLASLAELSVGNLTSVGRRLLGIRDAAPAAACATAR